ncbi:acyl transferase/acyl hydrolase/lysophospholipase [Usnea florida]
MAGDEWTRQAIISFDGGGIRGYGSLLMLQALMEKIAIEERRIDPTIESSFSPCIYKPTRVGFSTPFSKNGKSFEASRVTETNSNGLSDDSLFLPCHYFDYGAGTSTGGLISIMLFCLRMTVHDCINEYKILGDKIFGHPRPCSWGGILWPKYSSDALKRVVIEATARHNSTGYRLYYEIEDGLSQCIVVAYPDCSARGDVPYLFRTYKPPNNARDDVYEKLRSDPKHHPSSIPLHKVARATAAAPAYFRPVRILPAHRGVPQPAMRFKDGGFGCNNPSEEAYHDVVEVHGGLSKNIGPFVSIGTGVGKFKLFSDKKGHFWDVTANAVAAIKRPTLTTLTHKSMSYLAHFDRAERFPYYRFSGGDVLGEIAMDEWKTHDVSKAKKKHCSLKKQQQRQPQPPGSLTLQSISLATKHYLAPKDIQTSLQDCAKALVERRRRRAELDPARWERFATTAFYRCGEAGCEAGKGKVRFQTAADFRTHLESEHLLPGIGEGGGGGQGGGVDVDLDLDERVERGRGYAWVYPG